MPALARIVGNAGAERALARHGGELAASDLEAVEHWGWIADFDRDVDRWLDRPAGLDGAKYAEAFTGFLRGYFSNQPEIVAELDLDPLVQNRWAYRRDPQCCRSGLAPPASHAAGQPGGQMGQSVSGCGQNCHDGYKSCKVAAAARSVLSAEH